MAKNSVDSIVNLIDDTQVRLEGTLISVGKVSIVFKARKPGGRRMIQQSIPRDRVIAYHDTYMIVKRHTKLNSKVFRQLSGVVTEDNAGWLSVDGLTINPLYATVEADLGTEEASVKAKTAGAKKTKKKA